MSDFDPVSDPDDRRRFILAHEMNEADRILNQAIRRMRAREVTDVAISSVLLERALKTRFDALGPHFATVIHDAINRLASTEMRN